MPDTFLRLSATGWGAIFTLVIAVITFVQVCVYLAMLRTQKAVERAWVSLDTLDIELGNEIGDRIVAIGFKNSGNTPAHIISANISFRGAVFHPDAGGGTTVDNLNQLNETPEYDDGTFVPPAILVKGEASRWRYRVSVNDSGAWNLLTMTPGTKRPLWIYGYVTYRDTLMPRIVRTYGWAREYDPTLSQTAREFKFAHLSKPKYNYAD